MQTDLFAPEVSNERLDALIIEAHRKAGHVIREKGSEIGGWAGRQRYQEAHIHVGMEYFPVSSFRSVFRAFMEVSQ